MCLKKGLLFFLSTLIVFVSLSIISYVEATDVNPFEDSHFSKYINVMPGGIYNHPITVTSLYNNDKYNIAENYKEYCLANYQADIDSEIISTKKMPDIGFKCNNIFYRDNIVIKSSGTYVFEVCSYKETGGVYTPNSPIETLTIYYDDTNSLKIMQNDFYFEHYGTAKSLINDIKSNFNYVNKVSLSSTTLNNLENLFNRYANVRQNVNEKEDYSSKVDQQNVKLTAYYLNEEYEFYINLLSISNIELQSQFTDITTININSNNRFAFDVTYSDEFLGQNILTWIDYKELLNLHKAQIIEIEYVTNSVTIPSASSIKSGTPLIKSATFNIKDSFTGDVKEGLILHFAFYNSNFISFDNYEMHVSIKDDVKVGLNENIDVNKVLEDNYFTVKLNNIEYIDIISLYLPNITVKNFDSSIIGKTILDLIVTSTKYDLTAKKFIALECSFYIDIKDNCFPLILTQYNYILITKGDESYYNQIKCIDDDMVNLDTFTIEMMEENDDGGYFVVSIEDMSGNKSVRRISFIYKQKDSWYQKTIGKWLFEYGKFLREIF